MEYVLRELARQYFEIANSDENHRHILLHKQVNDKCMERPIVMIDEIPWHEMELESELTCVSSDEDLLPLETMFRRTLYQWKYMRADMVVRPYIGVKKVIYSTGIGVEQRVNEHETGALSHTFSEQFQCMEDLEKIHLEQITYDAEATRSKFEKIADIFSGIIPVKICGEATGYSLGMKPWDDISRLKNMETLFFDLVDQPELMHGLVSKLTAAFVDKVRQYNELELFDTDAYTCHSTSALTHDLRFDPDAPQSKMVWGRGLAQILASVSPEMHDEFDISYMVEALEPFGLVYYGCCEPLHQKIDILRKIKNLRKISITPWADYDVAAQAMGQDYVMAAKPNPSHLLTKNLDCEVIGGEFRHILTACRKNSCALELTLKDISSVCGRPQNLFDWEKTAMKMVKSW